MLLRKLTSFVRDDDGMEMVEWAIVGVVFALAAALFWSQLGSSINNALGSIGDCVNDSTNCPTAS
jgi:Flp pilus assembly pilin Flp